MHMLLMVNLVVWAMKPSWAINLRTLRARDLFHAIKIYVEVSPDRMLYVKDSIGQIFNIVHNNFLSLG